jgi:hypothetical protein
MAYDSKDERSNNLGKVSRYSGVKGGPGIPMQPRKQSEIGGKVAPGGRGTTPLRNEDFG